MLLSLDVLWMIMHKGNVGSLGNEEIYDKVMLDEGVFSNLLGECHSLGHR